MTTKSLLNVDYFRSLLIDDPSFFLNLNERNGFEAALRAEVSDLIKEVERRVSSLESKDRTLLTAKILDALGYPDGTTQWIKRYFSNFQERQEDILTAEQKSVRDSGMLYCETLLNLPHFIFIKDINPNRDELEKISDCCSVMNMHKRLVAVITDTPILNVGLNLKKPEEVQQSPIDTPVLGLHEPPAADNNYNWNSHEHIWELAVLEQFDGLAALHELEQLPDL